MKGSERIIEELRALVAEQAAKLEEQAARIAELELALAKAKRDSSLPPCHPRAILSILSTMRANHSRLHNRVSAIHNPCDVKPDERPDVRSNQQSPGPGVERPLVTVRCSVDYQAGNRAAPESCSRGRRTRRKAGRPDPELHNNCAAPARHVRACRWNSCCNCLSDGGNRCRSAEPA